MGRQIRRSSQRLILGATVALSLFSACGTSKVIPSSDKVVVNYVDSIAWHDSTIYYTVPVEKIKEVVPVYDTLLMETSIAKAQAYVDTTTHTLKGGIENKDNAIKQVIKWKEKIVYRDSIQVKEFPVETIKYVEVTKYPKTYWFFLAISVLCLAYLGVKLYFKFIKK